MSQYVKEDLTINNVYTAYRTIKDGQTVSNKEKIKIKNNIFNSILLFIVFSTIGLLLSKGIITAFEKQMPFDVNFVQLNPFEIFNSSVKVALIFGLYTTSPFIVYNFIRLYTDIINKIPAIDNKYIIKMIITGFVLFGAGGLFAFYISIPALLYFIMGFNASLATTAINISGYTSFCLQLIILTGLIFELPVFYMILNKTKLFDSKKLISLWKPTLICAALITFVLSSQDLLTQLFSISGIIILYGLCIFIAKLVEQN